MKKSALFLALSALATGSALAGTFTNGGFEDGNLGGWSGSGGCWGGGSSFGYSCGAAGAGGVVPYTGAPLPLNPALFTQAANNTIMSGGTDAHTGLSTVYNGSYSARVNDDINNYGVSVLKQSVAAYGDDHIYFEWQAVLEASHGLTDSDYFSLTLVDDTTGLTVASRAYSSAGSIGTGAGALTWISHSGWFSAGWVVEDIDLTTAGAGSTSLVGHNFTLTLLASDCPLGGHAGYVYLDGFGGVVVTPGPNGVPEPASLALLGLGLIGLGAARRRKTA